VHLGKGFKVVEKVTSAFDAAQQDAAPV